MIESGTAYVAMVIRWRRLYPNKEARRGQDLFLRLRNQLALDLLSRSEEFVVDDEPVLISTATAIGRRAERESLPTPGWLILTNCRLEFAAIEDGQPTEIPLNGARVTHVEGNWVTLAWREGGRGRAVSLGFAPKSKLLREVLTRLLIPPIADGSGRATPGRPTGIRRVAPRRRRSGSSAVGPADKADQGEGEDGALG